MLDRPEEVAMSEDSGYPTSGNSVTTDETFQQSDHHSESGDSTHTESNMAEKPGEETRLDRPEEVAMSEDSGYPGSGNSVTTEETVQQRDRHSDSGDSTHTESKMAEKHGEETMLDRPEEVAMSEDSGYPTSGNSVTTDETFQQSDHHSESGDSTHTESNMAEKPGEETRLDRPEEVAMSEDSGYPGSGNSVTTEETVQQRDRHSDSGDSTHTESKMAEKHGEETMLDRPEEVAMSEDSGYPTSGNSVTTDETFQQSDHHSESGDSTHTESNMAEKPGEETRLDRPEEVAMSEDSGYPGSGNSVTTEETVQQRDRHSDSGDSTHTVQGQTDTAAKPGPVEPQTQTWLPRGTEDPASRTEQWVDETFEVFVKNLDGKTHTIQVERFESVSTFKQKVGNKLGVPSEQQRLTSQEGKTLADDNLSLHDYNIKKHSTVYCQGRLRGGQTQL